MKRWSHNGIDSDEPENWLIGKYDGQEVGGCIILGCSRDVWTDYHAAKALFESKNDYNIIAINDMGIQFKAEHIEHIASVHQQMPGPVRALRMVRITNHPFTHSQRPYKGVDVTWGNLLPTGGTSALFAVKIAMAMGYKKIIVCGCALDKTGHYYDPEIPEDNANGWFDDSTRAPWLDFHKDIKEARRSVRFMSGDLQEIYGKPDHEWAYGREVCGSLES